MAFNWYAFEKGDYVEYQEKGRSRTLVVTKVEEGYIHCREMNVFEKLWQFVNQSLDGANR